MIKLQQEMNGMLIQFIYPIFVNFLNKQKLYFKKVKMINTIKPKEAVKLILQK